MTLALSELKVHDHGFIAPDLDPAFHELGFFVGDKLQVIGKNICSGPIVILKNEQEVFSLRFDLAKSIKVIYE